MKHVSGAVIVAASIFAVGFAAQGDSVTRAIIAEENDAEEHVNSGRTDPPGTMESLTSSDLEICSEGGGGLEWQVIGVQYDTLGIPQGSTINSATVTFQVDAAGVAGDPNTTLYAEATDNSAVFSSALANITSRPRTTASVAWAPALNNTVGAKVVTSDIATLIQEVVNRPGWAENNMLTIMIFPDPYLASPTGGTTVLQELEVEAGPGTDSATLTVDFTPPTPGEGEGEGEGEPQGNEILSNVYPPFIDVGTTVILTAPPGSGWQWAKDLADITGATDRELVFNPVKTSDAGSYTVTYDNGLKVLMTTPAFELIVSPEGTVPVGGGLALAALLGACALGGASALRRRK